MSGSNQFQTDPTQSWVAGLIDWSVSNRFFVLLGALVLLVAGMYSTVRTPLDAIPDLSDTQVIIRTDYAGQAPQVVEDQLTYPLASQMLGLPRTKVVRGYSMFGTSFVYVIFEDDVDMYWARSRTLEALSQVQSQLPAGISPQLGPDATGVGWVFQYALVDKSGKRDLAALRSLQDWFLRFELLTVDGVAEVASAGGFVKEYQVLVDPNRLRTFNISLPKVAQAVREANVEVGGRTLELSESEFMIRSRGYVSTLDDLRSTVIGSQNGVPVTLADVGTIQTGPAARRGIVEYNGEGETVSGIVVMRPGANALTVIEAVKARLEEIKPGLPEGVEIVSVYDRSKLIYGSMEYLWHKLLEESLMVALICFIFLLHARSALVAVVTLPLGILGAFIIMHAQGITANIMSLGGIAIAIGAMVDASIVMVENAHRKLAALPEDAPPEVRRENLLMAAKEVGPGLFFSLLIITVSFLPVFALTGQSAKMFTPLAYTKTYAMAWAAILSVTLVPILMLWFVRGKIRSEEENPINRFFVHLYQPILKIALSVPKITVWVAMLLGASMLWPVMKTGHEFMPPLYEGDLLYMPMTLPGVTPTQVRQILQVTNRMIKEFPEVEQVFGKAGRADTATDPAPLSMIETWIQLKPKTEWRPGMTPEKLIAELDEKVRLPGMMNSWGYPIKIRLDMLTTGIRTPVGIKISGPDLKGIDELARQVEGLVKEVPGTRSAIADRVQGGKYLEIQPDRHALARYGVDVGTVQKIIQIALGGMKLSEAVEGRERYNIMVRYDRPYRESVADLENILVPTPSGAHITLSQVAHITFTEGPPMIKSENARLNGWVFVDIQGRDIGSYISDTRKLLEEKLEMPTGYSLTFSGQFEQMQEANKRLSMAVPAALLLIITLLYLHFGRWDRTALIMLAVPFGLVGGFWGVYLAGYNMSVAVAVGFIALAGIAVETAIIMLIYIDQQVRLHPPKSYQELLEAVTHGAVLRVRPKLMTVSTIIFGLLPVFFTDGPGADVMRRIALPMVGGMASTTLLTLILIPVLYALYMRRLMGFTSTTKDK
ncbi:MAG: CusA/CzcA family heavy metal efflux RND transporter [Alphaproteobacteria bacterium CG_4_10_14_0_8_um_filter_53_9]|nr:MAG: CusA/CzcA family heavy metal efflux RND transporter [Alphaproteobacteria bacterium CG_4_10_14_0_8_um_filter_53_9]